MYFRATSLKIASVVPPSTKSVWAIRATWPRIYFLKTSFGPRSSPWGSTYIRWDRAVLARSLSFRESFISSTTSTKRDILLLWGVICESTIYTHSLLRNWRKHGLDYLDIPDTGLRFEADSFIRTLRDNPASWSYLNTPSHWTYSF